MTKEMDIKYNNPETSYFSVGFLGEDVVEEILNQDSNHGMWGNTQIIGGEPDP